MENPPKPPLSVGHAGRLEVLRDTALLDSLPEESFDRFTRLASALLKSEIALVSLVDEDRQFFKSALGLGGAPAEHRGTPLTHSFCKHVVADGRSLVVTDARTDDRVKSNPAVHEFGVVSYLGVPIRTCDGFILGSLCAINTTPRDWSEADEKLLTDLAATLTTEIELRDRSESIKVAFLLANADSEARREHLRALIHDLRSPVAAVTTCVDQLQEVDPNDKESISELNEICRESANHILAMIGELLKNEKISAGSDALELSLVSPGSVMRRATRFLAPVSEDAGIKITVELPETAFKIHADKSKLERVARNLIENAIKHSPPKTTIRVVVDRVEEDDQSWCRIRVIDQGPGVPEDEKESIFGHFVKGRTEQLRGEESFGIGLAFCKSVVAGHSGRIGVEDSPGGGSSFYIQLPIPD